MLTPAQVAARLKISRAELLRKARAGQIAHHRIGARCVRFAPEDVSAYMARLPGLYPPDRPLPTARALRVLDRMHAELRRHGEEVQAPLTDEQRAIAYEGYRRMVPAPWADRGAIAAIYREARRLTRETGQPHHVDHVIPLRGQYVSGLHVETNLRVVLRIDNLRKGNKVPSC